MTTRKPNSVSETSPTESIGAYTADPDIRPSQGADGRFLPGNRANPGGRPQSKGVNVDVLLRERLEERGNEYVDTVVNKALAGDYRFAELAVNRAYGTPVHRQIEITASAEMDRLVSVMASSLGLNPPSLPSPDTEPNST